ncbi:MAG: hypothetical protein KTR31_09700 [Myxococcales bacterium]|nr:hypothetical protein [Myxococcales bacterium]
MAAQSVPKKRKGMSPWIRVGIVASVLALLTVTFAILDLDPDLSHVDVAVLSGSPQGNYYAVVERAKAEAAEQNGTVDNVSTQGSLDNIERLAAATESCEASFALTQDGIPFPEEGLELLARLPESESVLFLGKEAASIGMVADLEGKRIGIGPEGSGTASLASALFASRGFQDLDVTLEHHAVADQMAMAERGELDLAMFVIVPNATYIDEAVRKKGLQIASFEHARSIAEHLPIVRSEVMPAGYYDPFLVVPPTSRHLLVVDTLLLGNGCSSRTETMGVMTLLETVYPEIIQHNLSIPNKTGLPENEAATTYFANGGPELLDLYAPWLANIIPLSNLIQLAMVISISMNLMTLGHKFRLWQIDANRNSLESRSADLLGTNVSDEIREMTAAEYRPDSLAPLDELIDELDALRHRVRNQALSMLVPLGQEMSYRHQETLVEERLTALMALRDELVKHIG